MTTRDVLAVLEQLAPPALAADWDNVGLLVENDRPVSGILTTLDITAATVQEALALDCSVIVSHHPVIFGGVKRLLCDDVPYLLARYNMAAICMHTNLDAAAGGTGDTLAGLLGLTEVKTFAAEEMPTLGRIGILPQDMTMEALAAWCKEKLQVPVRYVENGRSVRRIAIVTGAGDCVADALAAGADALITGEVHYHKALEAAAAGLGLVEAGHFGTEAPIAGVLARWLQTAFAELPVHQSRTMRDPFCLPADRTTVDENGVS